jgi:hypothetical protein
MSLERHRQREQRHQEALRVDRMPSKVDWDLFIQDAAPSQSVNMIRSFVFSKQVMYHPSRITYSSRGVNGSEDLEIDCE